MTGDRCWRVRLTLTAGAESDIRQILQWTSEQFGLAQAQVYSETLAQAILALTAGPHVTGSRRRENHLLQAPGEWGDMASYHLRQR